MLKGLAQYLRTLAASRRRRREPFERLFGRFRTVLDRNNRTLEVMTEMGDVLGGDYLFDIQYVKKAARELTAALAGSLDAFDELTGGRYPELRDVSRRIEQGITDAVEAAEPRTSEYVIFLDRITHDRVAAAGNKIGRIAELGKELALPVPDGFVVTTRGFDAFLRHNRLSERIRQITETNAAARAAVEEFHELVLQGEVPPELGDAIGKAVGALRSRCGRNCFLSVRSSASEEDGDRSFAGQFRTVLNVPLERGEVERAYRKVLASLFTEKVAVYQGRMGIPFGSIKMAVGCLIMIDADASGVLYTRDPGDPERMLVSAAWGLGPMVVEGGVDADHIAVARDGSGRVLEERVGAKERMMTPVAGGGVEIIATPVEKRSVPCLGPVRIAELTAIAERIEAHFHAAQDIEWAIDRQGRIVLLQSRSLRLPETKHATGKTPPPAGKVILRGKGLVVQKGTAAGRVFLTRTPQDLDDVPDGAVLVARNDSPNFIRVMPRIAAIVTDRGALTSHMASLSREFRVPTVVAAGDATAILTAGKEITLVAGDEGVSIYEGRAEGALERNAAQPSMEELFEYRRKRSILRSITPLRLVDPLRDEFTPSACRTVHDVLRFIHEKAVHELIEAAGRGLKAGRTIRLDLPVPAGLLVIDIGGGLEGVAGGSARPEQVVSIPLRAVVAGLTEPGIWRFDAVPLSVGDFMTSMLRVPDVVVDGEQHIGSNMAVVSREYMHLAFKFGYHFAVVDCHAGPIARNNHLYFRFAGGATDITKRSRRLQVIETILSGLGFSVKTRGDLLIARLAHVPQDDMTKVIIQLGRLLAFTRQLDAELSDDPAVERSIENFRRVQHVA